MTEFQVRKNDLTQSRLVETDDLDIESGEILVKVDRFALTANNITYGVAGDKLGYWQFFPPAGEDPHGWGVLPVWGFADVISSTIDEIPVGDRLYGYFPPATQLKMRPVNVSATRLIDGAEHRSSLPPGYNSYRRVNAEPTYQSDMDNERAVLFPLHITSFCLWDVLKGRDWYGARQLIIVSASSKTSVGLAYALAADESAPPQTGITSTRNIPLVKKLGIYDTTISYDDLTEINPTIPTVIVDMSANAKVLAKLHTHLGEQMKHCINVGLTHWDQSGATGGTISERSEFFFAPGHIQKRIKEWGAVGFEQKSQGFMRETAEKCRGWLQLREVEGLQGLADVYLDVCHGRVAADEGIVITSK